jgi:RNA polymerase sigma factor (sigma-70 family)
MEADDMALLRDYAKSGSEEAFRTVVERHIGMVYGVASRQLKDRQLVDEVTQAVFIALAKKAGHLPRGTIVAGWLFRAARFAAGKIQRSESRRIYWENQAANMDASSESSQTAWEQIVPCLNDALADLSSVDRAAIILRFFESKSFEEVGDSLGTTPAAAKMRLSRALEKLRQNFSRRGVVVPVAILIAALSTHAAQAAPPGLAAFIVSSALGNSITTSTLTKAILFMTLKQKVVVTTAVVIVLLTGGGTTAYVVKNLKAPPVAAAVTPVATAPKVTLAPARVPAPPLAEPVPVDVVSDDVVEVRDADGNNTKRTIVFRRGGPSTNEGTYAVRTFGGGNVELRKGRARVTLRAGAPGEPAVVEDFTPAPPDSEVAPLTPKPPTLGK